MQKYNTYKPSNVEWLGDVPSHWKVTRLINRTVRIVGGDWGDDPDLESDEHVLLPVIRVQDIDNEYEIGDQKLTYRKIKASKIDHRLIDSKTLLIEKSGGGEKQLVGRVAIPKKITMPAICSNFMEKIEMDEQAIPSFFNYVFHALYNLNMNFPFVQQTTGIQNLKSTYYFYTKVTYPNNAEQTAIAAYLDQATANIDQVIATKQKQLEKLDQYKRSKIHECVTKGLDASVQLKASGVEWLGDVASHWETVSLKNYTYIFASNVDKKIEEGEIEVELCNYVDVYKNDVITEQLEFMVASATQAEIEKFILQPKDILVTKDSETPDDIAVPAIVKFTKEKLLCGYHLMIIRCFKNLLPDYLIWVLRDLNIATQFHREAVGITRFGLAAKHFKNGIVPLPEKKEQVQIADYLDNFCNSISKEKNILEQQIEKLKQYRKCLIHECVTGKRKVIND